MNCPKCKIKMVNGCCLKCGYMSNGNTVTLKDKIDESVDDLKLYDNKFDTHIRNSNFYIPLLIGPLYLSYRGNLFIGTFIGLIDYFLFYELNLYCSKLYFSFIPIYASIFYIIITRLFYSTLLNTICLKLDELKIKNIKKIYNNKYRKELVKHHDHFGFILITILIYVLIAYLLIKNV